ncbi:rod shape-determining protein [Candidatus Shapirobacteria bacterium CG09_land_8_20_14_0_10_47_13]|uniref:Cell shape-determining protein MreB n=1 Tax=Candidatus Shapirobacteria bacterium CG09_land_8_20_14_0_10_47_13 TaxID=1974481 RepID=A0A2H0WN60_9BACT|nr:MAG: rod shape-determining protein [Candidatus Shapirobacteria bacterium CG09_land_8_20_14_0_10_47_13]
MLESLFSFLTYDLGIDMGTANTLVLVKGKGIVIREPSVVARHKKTKQIIAIGGQAKKMIGKTPLTVEIVRPLKDGVIVDFDATEVLLAHYIQEAQRPPKIPKPRVVIGIPSGVTEVERRAVQEACLAAGARKAYLIEEPMAAAIGLGLPIDRPEGALLVDIGGGTTEIAVISLGGIVVERCLRVAGAEMDEAVMAFLRLKYSILLGEATAEDIKIQLGSAMPLGSVEKENHLIVRGRGLETGLPKSIKISASEVREAIAPIVQQILETITGVIEETPPELVADIVARGIILYGGTAQLAGLDKLIAEETKMPVWLADDPMTVVVRGCGKLLADEKLLARVRVTGGLK